MRSDKRKFTTSIRIAVGLVSGRDGERANEEEKLTSKKDTIIILFCVIALPYKIGVSDYCLLASRRTKYPNNGFYKKKDPREGSMGITKEWQEVFVIY